MTHFLTHVERLAIWSVIACVLAFAGFQLGGLGSRVAFQDTGASDTLDTSPPAFEDDAAPVKDTRSRTVHAIFGDPEVQETPAVTPVAAPVESTPNKNYDLQGITVVGRARWAMLNADGASFLVREGDTLTDGEAVKEITPSAVILEQNGTLTVLKFTRSEPGPATGTAEASPEFMADFSPVQDEPDQPRLTTLTPVEPSEDTAETVELVQPPLPLQTLRRAIYAPNALSNVRFVRARTLTGGVGMQIKWIKDSPLISAAGLQRGDILVSINKLSLDNISGIQGLLLGLGKLDSIEIEYERRQKPIRVTIPLTKS